MTLVPVASRIASFDVFDTVLVRSVGNPEGMFLLLGQRLAGTGLIRCTPEVFARARRAADRRAYARAGREGRVTAATIGAELGSLLGLAEADWRAIIGAEQALEAELLRPSPVGRRLVADARARGEQVAFVSDMYLSSSFVGDQLRRHGLLLDGERVYVSSEHPGSKRSGRLYTTVAETEGVAASSVVHHGNDRNGDVVGARLAGARSRHVPDGNLNRYERLLCCNPDVDGLGSVLAGASRLARLGVQVRSPREAAIRDVTAGVAAPVLTAYVLWVLSRARQRGLERLFFLSRDGQVLYDIARQLAGRLGLGIELRYLHASREAWNLAAVSADPGDISWALTHSGGATLQGLLQRLGIVPEEVADPQLRLGTRPADGGRALSAGERTALLEALDRPPLRDLVRSRAAERYALLHDYLRQEDLLVSAPAGLVDIVARGSQHRTACLLARREGCPQPVAFYAGRERHETRPAVPERADLVDTYLFDDQRALGSPPPPGGVPLLLAFCTADHGSVLGYERQAAGVAPILVAARNDPAIEWGLPLLRRTVSAFVDALTVDELALTRSSDVRRETVAVLERFWSRPSRAEAASWGDFPFEYGSGTEARYSRLGAPYRWSDVAARAACGMESGSWRWPAGGVANSRFDVRLGVRAAAAAQRGGRGAAVRLAKAVLGADGAVAKTARGPARRLATALGPPSQPPSQPTDLRPTQP